MANPLLAPKQYKTLQKKRQGRVSIPDLSPTQHNLRPPADPFAAMSPGSIDQTVNKYVGMYGTPQTNDQIQAGAQAQVDPIVAALTKQINDRAASSSRAITGNANSLAASLGKIDYAAPYAGATHDQAAVNAALQQSLSGGGNALAQDLQNRLGVIDDPTVAAAGGAVSAYGAGTGNTQLADGSANIGQLLAESAAAKTYGLKQPGIARMQGLQDVAGVNQQAVNDIGSGTTSILQQLPSIVQAMQSRNQGIRDSRAGGAAQLFETLTGQNVTKATAKAGLQNTAFDNSLAASNAAADNYYKDASLGIQQQNANTAANRAATAAKKVTAPKVLTASDKAKLSKSAETLRYGVAPKQQYDSKTSTWLDVPNTGTPNSSYDEAYQSLVAQGATPAYARAQVNRLYKPGEYGRPASKGQKKTARAVKSGLGVPKTTGPFAGLGG